MSTLCACDYTLSNSGTGKCPSIAKGTRLLIGMNLYKKDGSKNSIPLATLQDKALMQSLIEDAIRENRIYPLPKMVNVENLRADAVTQEFNDGSLAFIRKGIKSFTGYFKQVGYRYSGSLDENRNVEHGYIAVDEDGNFIFKYESSDPNNAYPIDIDRESYHVDLLEHVTGSEIQLSKIMFNWSVDVKDGDLRVVKKPASYNPLTELKGLLDTVAVFTGISTTTVTATLTDVNDCPISGLVQADFSIAEISPVPGAVSISSVTESADGVYDIVFVAETSGDELALTIDQTGYDSANITANTFLIP